MLDQPEFRWEDAAAMRELIAAHPWALLVSAAPGGADPVVSPLPVIPDPASDGTVVLSHLGAVDAELHRLGSVRTVLIVQGPHGYVSASFYKDGPYVPTWNYVAVHLHGVPELLDAAETYDVLSRTVDACEAARPSPFRLASVSEYAHEIAPGTTGFRLRPDQVVGKLKLSQDKPREVVERVVTALDTDPVHASPALADAMRRWSL